MAEQKEAAQPYPDTPAGQAQRWAVEIKRAKDYLAKFHERGDTIDKVFRDERDSAQSGETRLNLFSSGIITKRALLFGKIPQVDVARRFGDANDDAGRVAGELMERMLNSDIEEDGDSCAEAVGLALDDRLLPGMAFVRERYVCTMEKVPGKPAMLHPETGAVLAPEVPDTERKCDEDVETDYVHWKDVLWSPCRVWREVEWVAIRAQMSRDKLIERFGEDVGKGVPLNSKKGATDEEKRSDPEGRADVWEIWDKENEQLVFHVEGHDVVLEQAPDPHELPGFFPFPRPMMANLTTSKLVPVADYVLSQDLHKQSNDISTRIGLLVGAVRVAGVYDKSAGAIAELVKPSDENKLYPVDNWAMFADKGGIRGQIDWLPLEQIVNAIGVLRAEKGQLKDELYEVEGMSDIMRGQAGQQGVTATEQGIKARFGSVRIQALQDEFARFVSDLQRIKAHLIAKHFEPTTIFERSNAKYMMDAPQPQPMQQLPMGPLMQHEGGGFSRTSQQPPGMPGQPPQLPPKQPGQPGMVTPDVIHEAIMLIKSGVSDYRIEVKPENVSLTDFSAQKAERTEVITSISQYMVAMGPLVQQLPGAAPFMLQILQWMVAGLRGASSIEGVLDQAIAQAQAAAAQAAANPPQQQQDPKLVAQQMKGQQDMQKIQADTQSKIQIEQAKVQGDAQREENQMVWNVREAAAKHQIIESGQPATGGPPSKLNGGIL